MPEEEKVVERLVSSLEEPLKELKKLQDMKLHYVLEMAEDIINTKTAPVDEIERVLDYLLDLSYWYQEEIEGVFHQLVECLVMKDPESSEMYQRAFLEIISEDDLEE